MMAQLKDVYRGVKSGWVVTFTTLTDPRELYDQLKEDDVDITIKKWRKKRSLDANGFAWALIDQIAAKMRISKTEVYRQAIREIGGVSTTVCVQDKAVERLKTSWQSNGTGWQAETFPSKIEGCTNVILYYGSSVYDTEQMSRLIDSLIQEAEALGIPTIPDAEAQRLIGNWGRKEK